MKFKKILVWLLILSLLSISSFLLYKELTEFSVNRIEIVSDKRVFDKTPDSFNGTSIVFISDIHYNAFMDKTRLLPFIEKIKQLEPDIVLFGGDLFDHPSVTLPSEAIIAELTQLLTSIDAPLGKYAVLGNHDHESSMTRAIVIQTLEDADFQVLINDEVHVYNQQQDKISIIGIDSQLLGSPNVDAAFSSHDDSLLTIVISHTPDIIDLLPINKVDWQLSGHSHGGQIALPFIGPLYKVPFAQNHIKPTSVVNGIRLDVSNGLGTTRYDMRLFANPQIHYYTLSNDE